MASLSKTQIGKAREAASLLTSLLECASEEGSSATTQNGSQNADRPNRTQDILKSADKAMKALRGMKTNLEGSGSSRKRRAKTEIGSLFQKKPKKCVWKHRFVCLAVVGDPKIPTSSVTKDDLLKADLGEKCIEFSNLECDANEFRDVIYSYFPKLKEGGGFEFCKCPPNSRMLDVLSPAAHSSPLLLKERVGTTRTYIRPLQRDLEMDEVCALPEGAIEVCLKCGKELPLTSLKEHISVCRPTLFDSPSPVSSLDDLPPVFFKDEEMAVPCTEPEVVTVDSSSDAEDYLFQEAVRRSLEPDRALDHCTSVVPPVTDDSNSSSSQLSVAVRSFTKDIINESLPPLCLDIRRRFLLRDAMKEASKTKFSTFKPVKITFVGESALDYGGPSREFFRLLTIEAAEHYFEGDMKAKFFVNRVTALQKRELFMLGQYIAMSIAHGGSGFPVIAKPVYKYISTGKYEDFCVTPDNIPEGALKFAVKAINNSEDNAQLQAVLSIDEVIDLMSVAGYAKPLSSVTLENRSDLVSSIVLYHLMIKVKSSVDQFMDGLLESKLLSRIRNNPEAWEPLFVNQHESITVDTFKDLFCVMFSDAGSSKRLREEDTYVFFGDFLDDVFDHKKEDDCTVEDVLVFLSGSDRVPPLGYKKRPSITFHSNGPLATASTCDLELRLPIVHTEFSQFREYMLMSIKGNDGFGCA